MRHSVQKLETKRSVAVGTALDIKHLEQVAVYFGTEDGVAPVGTFKLQGQVSGDGVTMNEWVDINAALGAGTITQIPNGYTKLRVNTTAYTSGTVNALVSGKESRTDF